MCAKLKRSFMAGTAWRVTTARPIFIPFVLPGEEAEVRITECRKRFRRGEEALYHALQRTARQLRLSPLHRTAADASTSTPHYEAQLDTRSKSSAKHSAAWAESNGKAR